MTNIHKLTKISGTFYVPNMAPQHFALTHMVCYTSMMKELQTTFNRLYLRVGRLVIRPALISSATEERSMLHNMLICLAIFLRFIRSTQSGNVNCSPNVRLSGLERYWLPRYEKYTIENLLLELFGTLKLENTMTYQLALLLRVDFSQSAHSIIQGLIQNELHYIDALKSSLPLTLDSSVLRLICLPGLVRAASALKFKAS